MFLFILHFHHLDTASNSFEADTKENNKPTVYFLSLVATSIQGFPERELYLYDVATEMEFQGFQVKFLSVKEIEEFYRKHHPVFDEDKVTIYEMTLFFIQMNKGSSFFMDEVPFISRFDISK